MTNLAGIGFTGIGSLPGDDIISAVSFAFDASPGLPWLPELPARGPGADMIGRTLAAMSSAADWGFDLQPAGWRLIGGNSFDAARAREFMSGDIDALLAFADFDGRFKVSLTGPWTIAATVELTRGGRALRDLGAVRDIVATLGETVRVQLDEVGKRMPRAEFILQIDEPALPVVVEGGVATESGFGRIAAVPANEVTASLATVIDAAAVPVVVHCCADGPPLELFADAGAAAVSFDATRLLSGQDRLDENLIGGLIDRDVQLWLGALPSLGPGTPPAPRTVAEPIRRLWKSLGFPPEELADRIVLTTACGLAGASIGWTRESMRILSQAARGLSEAPESLRQ